MNPIEYKTTLFLNLKRVLGNDAIVKLIFEFIEYDELSNQTIRDAVKDYCNYEMLEKEQGFLKKQLIKFKYGPLIGWWKVKKVTNMNHVFYNCLYFNENLTWWDVSNVVKMSNMFYKASSFNGDISQWNVSNVKEMNFMFCEAYSFNGDLSLWNVSKVKSMKSMFRNAYSFEGDLSCWNISHGVNSKKMFDGTKRCVKTLLSWYKNVQNTDVKMI